MLILPLCRKRPPTHPHLYARLCPRLAILAAIILLFPPRYLRLEKRSEDGLTLDVHSKLTKEAGGRKAGGQEGASP